MVIPLDGVFPLAPFDLPALIDSRLVDDYSGLAVLGYYTACLMVHVSPSSNWLYGSMVASAGGLSASGVIVGGPSPNSGVSKEGDG